MPEPGAAFVLPPLDAPNERGEVVVPVTVATEIAEAMQGDEGWEVHPGLRVHLMTDHHGGITLMFQRVEP